MTYDGYTKYDAAVAASYDSDREQEEHWKAENAFVRAYADAHRLGAVLDVPVGTGRLLPALAMAERIVGVDVSKDMLAEARKVAQSLQLSQAQLAHGDALALRHSKDEFDTVLCFRLLHLLPPELAPRLLNELARVCKGTVLLQIYVGKQGTTSGVSHFVARVRRFARRLIGTDPTAPWSHIQSYTHSSDSILEWTQAAGLRLIARHVLCKYEGTSVEVLELSR